MSLVTVSYLHGAMVVVISFRLELGSLSVLLNLSLYLFFLTVLLLEGRGFELREFSCTSRYSGRSDNVRQFLPENFSVWGCGSHPAGMFYTIQNGTRLMFNGEYHPQPVKLKEQFGSPYCRHLHVVISCRCLSA